MGAQPDQGASDGDALNATRGELIAAIALGLTVAGGIATVAQWKGETEQQMSQRATIMAQRNREIDTDAARRDREIDSLERRVSSIEQEMRHRP